MFAKQNTSRRARSIRFYAIALVLITALPLILATAVDVLNQAEREEDLAHEQLRVLAADAAVDVERWMKGNKSLLTTIAARPSTKALKCEPFIKDFIDFSAELNVLLLINRAGDVICQYSKTQFDMPGPQAMLSRPIVKAVMQSNDFIFGPVEQGLTHKVWLVVSGLPVTGADDSVVGYLFLTTDIIKANYKLFEGKPRSPTITVVDKTGRRAFRWPDPEDAIGKEIKLQNRIVPPDIMNDEKARSSVKPLLAEGGPILDSGWQVAVSLPRNEFIESGIRDAYTLILFLGLATSLTIAATYFGTRSISRPIQTIAKMAGSIRSARYMPELSSSVVPLEIAETANALIRMNRDLAASESRYRALIDGANAVVWEADAQTLKLTFVSDQVRKLLGYTPEEWMKSDVDWSNHIHPDDLKSAIEQARIGIANGKPWEQSYRVRANDGRIVWVRNLCAIDSDLGVIRGLTFDITKHIELESVLAAQDARNRAIIDASPIPSALNDDRGNIVFLNRAFVETVGYGAEDIPTLSDWWPKAYPDPSYRQWVLNEWSQRLSDAQKSGLPFKSLELKIATKTGKEIMAIGVATSLAGYENKLHLITLIDITERAAMEQKLAISEKLNREIINASPVPMRVNDRKGDTLYVNNSFQEIFGYSISDIPTFDDWQAIAFPDPHYAKIVDDKWKAASTQSGATGQPFVPIQIDIQTKDGRSVPVLALSRSLSNGADTVRISMYFDISERVALEKRLEAANHFAQSTIDALSKEICVIDETGQILEVNKAWRDYAAEKIPTGYDWIGQNYLSICEQAIALGDLEAIKPKKLIQDVLEGTFYRGEIEYSCQVNGEKQSFLMTVTRFEDGIRRGAVIGHRNITELRNSQEKLAQSDKLSAVGQLTGGVAHDINNALAVIVGNTELIAHSADPDSLTAKLSQRVLKAANGAAGLIGRLLAFSRKSPIEPESLELSSVVADVIKTLSRTLGGRITVKFIPAPDAVWVHLDRAMLESCLINLSVNARDAMPDGGDLTFTITTEKNRSADDQHGWAVLSVKDSGTGMPEEVRNKVFEPFFTTKPVGRGTGLGLAMVYGFIKQSMGDIEVASTPGVGTTFIMHFPLKEVAKVASEETSQTKFRLRDDFRILVVDDNDDLRETIRNQLESVGAQVLEASSVEAGRNLINQDPEIAFVISDLALGPGETGIELAEWIKKQGLKIPGAIMSGYIDIEPERVTRLGWKWLQKPTQLKDIVSLLANN